MTDVTVTNEPPVGNQPEARDQTGTLIDQSTGNTTPSPEPKSDKSFLNGEPEPKPEPKAEDKKPDGEAKPEDKKPDAPQGAPEKYADFTLPEGLSLDKDTLAAATATFKELDLPQEGAQKLVDFYAKNLADAATAPYKAWADTQKQWGTEITARFGDRADGVRADINKAINTALPPTLAKNLRGALDLTGAGTNPDIVEALSILLKPHYEGKPVPGGRPSPEGQKPPGAPAQISIADAMYPHLRK